MSKEGHADARRSEVLYTAGYARQDCCARCRHSTMGRKKLYCHQVRGSVAVLGICAQWAPVVRRVPV